MERKEINEYVVIYGNKESIKKAEEALKGVELTGNTDKDSITLQEIKSNLRLKATYMLDGRTIFSYEPLVRELKQMVDTDSIRNISKRCYEFLTLNFDIAHYDIYGYIDYYDGKWSRLYKETLEREWNRYGFIGSTKRIIKDVQKYIEDKENGIVPIETEKKRSRFIKKKKAEPSVTTDFDKTFTDSGECDNKNCFFELMGISPAEGEESPKVKAHGKRKKAVNHQAAGQTTLLELMSDLAG